MKNYVKILKKLKSIIDTKCTSWLGKIKKKYSEKKDRYFIIL
jgi:hypothetical protein